MQDNEPTEKSEGKKEAVVCPITMSLVKQPCPVKTCMWNAEGACCYKADATELDLGERKGISLSKSMLEARKGKANITKVLILDKYVSWVVENYPEKTKYSKKLRKDEFVKEARLASRLFPEAFDISLYCFCTLCKSSVFNKFIQQFPELGRNKLPSILGLRENTISKVRKHYKKLTRRGKSKSNPKIQ